MILKRFKFKGIKMTIKNQCYIIRIVLYNLHSYHNGSNTLINYRIKIWIRYRFLSLLYFKCFFLNFLIGMF